MANEDMAKAAKLVRVLQSQKRYVKAETALERARQARDEAIRGASSAGFSRRSLAKAAGLTAGRIQQIVDDVKVESRGGDG